MIQKCLRVVSARSCRRIGARACLLVVLIAALAIGLYGRFVGLGLWAFGVDEFYISRSIDQVLKTGLPRFLCGGFYTRGLTYQYAVALVRHFSLSPEFASRLVSAVLGLVGLPAAYVIGRRLGGRTLGLLMLIILSASIWEIEMARFARMYAPFQSIFLWYLVFFLRYTVDREKSALLPMVLLSVLGVLTWEGGIMLGVANLLPPLRNHERGRLRRADFWHHLRACCFCSALWWLRPRICGVGLGRAMDGRSALKTLVGRCPRTCRSIPPTWAGWLRLSPCSWR